MIKISYFITMDIILATETHGITLKHLSNIPSPTWERAGERE